MPRVLLVVVALAFTVYCVVDVIKSDADRVRALPKAMWVVVTALFPALGGLVWMVVGRPRRNPVDPGPRRGPLGPDDDPDFLRGL